MHWIFFFAFFLSSHLIELRANFNDLGPHGQDGVNEMCENVMASGWLHHCNLALQIISDKIFTLAARVSSTLSARSQIGSFNYFEQSHRDCCRSIACLVSLLIDTIHRRDLLLTYPPPPPPCPPAGRFVFFLLLFIMSSSGEFESLRIKLKFRRETGILTNFHSTLATFNWN